MKNKMSFWKRVFSLSMAFIMIYESFFPAAAWALTGGPSQPEVQSFEPVGTNQMVDLFSGDFTYNIPLLDVGGYPVNISYHGGPSADEEASWVGLGWNINPGVINRATRGLPDDFNGDEVKKEINIEKNWTVGASIGLGFEVFGFLGIGFGMGMNYNNYIGVGFEESLNLSVSAGKGGDTPMTAGLGLSSSASGGMTISPSVSLSCTSQQSSTLDNTVSLSVGTSINSRQGMSGITMSASFERKQMTYKMVKNKKTGTEKLSRVSTGGGSVGNGSTISFSSPTYTPNIDISMKNYSVTGKLNLGGTVFGGDITFDIMGYYSEQSVLDQFLTNKGYGYLYSQEGQGSLDALHDFNREKDLGFNRSTPNLPVTGYTYDTYSVQGQGIGGQYRPYRSDVGHVYDNKMTNVSASLDFGVEVAGAQTFHGGGNVNLTMVNTASKRWQAANNALENFLFSGPIPNSSYEPVYFKQVGELSIDDDDAFLDAIHRERAMDIEVQSTGPLSSRANSKLRVKEPSGSMSLDGVSSPIKRSKRVKRNQAITFLIMAEASDYALQPSLYDGGADDVFQGEPHHIAEITALRPDGSRYVYGIPAYNTRQDEVTFNASGLAVADGLIASYTATTAVEDGITVQTGDNSVHNGRGKDRYFNKVSTPPFAHSYLLTAVLSADYVDSDGVPGPSPGDLGTYTLFNYEKTESGYKWRVPFEDANAYEGIRALNDDNKANYIYGEKEIWYLKEIRSKTQTALFHCSDREDGRGVQNENGGGLGGRMHKLDSISLYSLPDFVENDFDATPVKRVVFDYEGDELCDGIPNRDGGGGKLTLFGLHFKYGNSNRGRFSPYVFTYSSYDPAYGLKNYDRWGNHQQTPSAGLNNSEFPYTDQAQADLNAQAWNLKTIRLPSGGEIVVNIEADDYAYVQDKRAFQMFKLTGAKEDGGTFSANSNLYGDASGSFPKLCLRFTLVPGTGIADYLTPEIEENLYFRTLIHIRPGDPGEFVSGYARVMDSGDDGTNGWVTLMPVTANGDEGDFFTADVENGEHPFARAAWHYGRANCSNYAYGQPEYVGSASEIVQNMAQSSLIANIGELFEGANVHLKGLGCGMTFECTKSFIRLQNPNFKKKGGGHRVSSITISDQWATMAGGEAESNVYGQSYTYLIPGTSRSSGVASWEPAAGGDENCFRKPIYFSEERLLTPDDRHYQEEPMGEMFFPSPTVGYSHVTVKDIKPDGFTFNQRSTGRTIHEFYTSRDYPTITDRTQVQAIEKNTDPIFSMFSFSTQNQLTASQGFVVDLNDMHGKQKAVSIYAGNDSIPFSKVEYFYKDQGPGSKRLSNEVTVIHKNTSDDSRIQNNASIGVEYDVITDFRDNETTTLGGGVAINTAGFLVGMFPGVVPTIMPSFSFSKRQFRSATVTKVVNRFGILDRTVATKDGSTIETKNLAFDAETGEVLLTQTVNEFHDPIYQFTYPAHWAYDRMGPAYKNIGFTKSVAISSTGSFTNSGEFVEGDEVAIVGESGRYWVAVDAANPPSIPDPTYYFIDLFGDPFGPNASKTVKVIRSGRRNMQTLPIGTLTLKRNPLDGPELVFEDEGAGGLGTDLTENNGKEVLQASAIEYSDKWQMQCNECTEYGRGCQLNTSIATKDGSNGSLSVPPGADYYQWFVDGTPISGANSYSIETASFCGESSSEHIFGVYIINDGCYGYETIEYECGFEYEDGVSAALSTMGGSGGSETSTIGTTVNPYLKGLRGIFRQRKSYAYQSARNQTSDSGSDWDTDIRNDGTLLTLDPGTGDVLPFQPFWSAPGAEGDWGQASNAEDHWQWKAEVTKFHPVGQEVENRDPLQRYSAALFGYNNTLATAVAKNAAYNEIGSENFEDVPPYNPITEKQCLNPHWPIDPDQPSMGIELSQVFAHTGRHSAELDPGAVLTVSADMIHDTCDMTNDTVPFTVRSCDCVGRFAPNTKDGQRKFIVSMWVKQDITGQAVLSYPDAILMVTDDQGLVSLGAEYRSPVIDGWQQISRVFELDHPSPLPGSPAELTVAITAGTHRTYVDDIRIQPFNSSMKTYVYDPISLRLVAELDDNNFATFYEYDEEGMLIRVKKETERGIKTIKEARQAKPKS